MPGYRRPKIAAERVGAAIKSGAASSASLGGEIIATPVRAPAAHGRPRAQTIVGVFSAAGPLAVQVYNLGLDNTYGKPLTIGRLTARLGTAPTGGPCTVNVRLNGADVIGTITIPAGALTGVTNTATVWTLADYLVVETVTANGAGDLVVQVVA